MMEVSIGSDGMVCGRCIPHKTLKIIVLSGAGLILAMCLTIEILALVYKKKIEEADDGDYFANAASSSLFFFNVYQYVGIIGGIATILGIIGILKTNKYLLTCFNTCNCCLFWVFAIIYGVVSFFSKISDFINNTGCLSTTDMLRDALYKEAAQNLCQGGCECYFSGTVSKSQMQYVINYSPTDTTQAVNYQQCPYPFSKAKEELMAELKQSEDFYECSGWCENTYPIQYFNNVNSNIASDYSCKKTIDKYWSTFRNALQYTSFLLGMFFVVTFGFTCIYCFYPQGDPKKDIPTNIRLINT